MNYNDQFILLRNAYRGAGDSIRVPELGIKISRVDFSSGNYGIFKPRDAAGPGSNMFTALLKYYLSKNSFTSKYFFNALDASDEEIDENRNFTYLLLQSENENKSKGIIILLHGLNERSWEKYLTWAAELNRLTGKAVLCFPTAFHMNRAPGFWSNPRLMAEVSRERQSLFPEIRENSFANTAISTRLSYSPRRFLSAGLQTYHDIIKLIKGIKSGDHPLIEREAGADIFSYSMGAFLGEMLMMINPLKFFDNSRLFIFCGGPTLDLMTPVSRAIIDSEAHEALRGFYLHDFNLKINEDEILRRYFRSHQSETEYLNSFLGFGNNRSLRENRLNELKEQVSILALVKDKIIPSNGISRTFNNFVNKLSQVKILNFSHKYSHENPFPVSEKEKEIVDFNFKQSFKFAGSFLA